MKRLIIIWGIFIICISFINSQYYAISNIPDSLLKNSDAIIRTNNTTLKVNSESSISFTVTKAITITNKESEGFANFKLEFNKDIKFTDFNGAIYDAKGNRIVKIKKSELQKSEYTEQSLADDISFYYLRPKISTFPCTVEYDYEVEVKNRIISFPSFVPLPYRSGVSLQNASYILYVPKEYSFKIKNLNTNIEPLKSNFGDIDKYSWTMENIPAYKELPYMPDFDEYAPWIYIAPTRFFNNNDLVDMSNWRNYGDWIYSLTKDRDILPEDLKNEVSKITGHLSNDKDKVNALYEYLCKNCRYVSVQIGIGGLQPMPAKDVFQNKFGDCKALSNYLKAMLKECNINAYYTLVSTENANLFEDPVLPSRINHVILNVPLKNDTLWIECTNSTNPMGYIHNSIAGHDCIVISNNSSKLMRIPKRADSLNINSQKIEINVNSSLEAEGCINKFCKNVEYERVASFKYLKEDEKNDYFAKYIDIPKLQIKSSSLQNESVLKPEITFGAKFHSNQFCKVTGSRLFIPINSFRKHTLRLDHKRDLDIIVSNGYTEIDTINMILPENVIIESLPKNVDYNSKFGKINSKIIQNGQTIQIIQRLLIKSGKYSKLEIEEFAKFNNIIRLAYNSNIVAKIKK